MVIAASFSEESEQTALVAPQADSNSLSAFSLLQLTEFYFSRLYKHPWLLQHINLKMTKKNCMRLIPNVLTCNIWLRIQVKGHGRRISNGFLFKLPVEVICNLMKNTKFMNLQTWEVTNDNYLLLMVFSLRFWRNIWQLEVLAKAPADLGSVHIGEEEMCWFEGSRSCLKTVTSSLLHPLPMVGGGAVKANILWLTTTGLF